MQQIFNINGYEGALEEFKSPEDLKGLYTPYGCSGLEVIFCGDGWQRVIKPGMVKGIHMSFFPFWLDYWNGDEERVFDELESKELAEGFYMGAMEDAKETLLNWYRNDLRLADELDVEYVVFHVSEVTIAGVYTGRHIHSDEEVIDGAAEAINMLLADRKENPTFAFLVENLQHPGLNFMDPIITERLLSKMEYPNKGIMLDVGHLAGCRPALASEKGAVAFFEEVWKAHETVQEYIRGIHLHSSLGALKGPRYFEQDPTHGKPYYDRFSEVYKFLGMVDPHRPFTERDSGLAELIASINPEWLVHEILPGADRKIREEALKVQSSVISQQVK